MTENPFVFPPTLTSRTAFALVGAAASAAAEIGKPVSITVVDNAGRVLAILRMDGAPFQSLQVSHDKAYTSAGYGTPSQSWLERAAQFGENGPAIITSAIDRLFPLAGGVPILSGEVAAGAIGVSGATASQDEQIAERAIASVIGSDVRN